MKQSIAILSATICLLMPVVSSHAALYWTGNRTDWLDGNNDAWNTADNLTGTDTNWNNDGTEVADVDGTVNIERMQAFDANTYTLAEDGGELVFDDTGSIGVGQGATLVINAIIAGAGTSLTKELNDAVEFAHTNNTFSGQLIHTTGNLTFHSIRDVGEGPSSLGAPTTEANGTIDLRNASLIYAGTGDSTDRKIVLTGGGLLATASGSGNLTFDRTGTVISGTDVNLRFHPSNASTIRVDGAISLGHGALRVDDNGGTVYLSGTNTYGGKTLIQSHEHPTLAFDWIANEGIPSPLGTNAIVQI